MINHNEIISSSADYDQVANIIAKANDLCEYYGAKSGHYDTHASAEFYHEDLGIPLSKCRKIVRYLKQEKVFYKARVGQNTFGPNDPSAGWTDYDKPHADQIAYYGIDKNAIRSLLPTWKVLQNSDPLTKVIGQ